MNGKETLITYAVILLTNQDIYQNYLIYKVLCLYNRV